MKKKAQDQRIHYLEEDFLRKRLSNKLANDLDATKQTKIKQRLPERK